MYKLFHSSYVEKLTFFSSKEGRFSNSTYMFKQHNNPNNAKIRKNSFFVYHKGHLSRNDCINVKDNMGSMIDLNCSFDDPSSKPEVNAKKAPLARDSSSWVISSHLSLRKEDMTSTTENKNNLIFPLDQYNTLLYYQILVLNKQEELNSLPRQLCHLNQLILLN